MKLTKSITVKTFALMAAAVLTVSSPLAVFAADQTSMNDQATEAAQKFYRAALEAGNDEETAMKIAQDAVIKTKKAIVQKKAEDISDGTVSDELTDEERQILDEVMKEDTAQSAAAASTESSETSAASTQSGADLQAQAENQNDAALYLSQAAAQAKDIQDAASMASTEAAAAASTDAAATASTEAAATASTNAAATASTNAAPAASTEAAAAASPNAAPTAGTEAAAAATTETAAAQTQTQQQTPAASYQAAQALQALQQVQLQQAQAAAQAAQEQAAAQTNTAVSASDRELLAAIIYCEAGNQSHTGKVAVGNVVMNRVNSAKFPNSISSVVYQRGQFSPAGSGWLNRVLKRGTVPADCYAAADEALAGSKPVGGSVFFMRRELHSSGTIIGAHCFWGMM